MHDAQYRAEVARQSTAYNQPSYTSFYFGSDTNWANVPVPSFSTPGVLSVLEEAISQYQANGELTGPLVPKLENSLRQAEHHLEKGSVVQALKFIEEYQSEINHSRNAGNISENARLNLSHKAELLIGMWERMNE